MLKHTVIIGLAQTAFLLVRLSLSLSVNVQIRRRILTENVVTCWTSISDDLDGLDKARSCFEDILRQQSQGPDVSNTIQFPGRKEEYIPPPLTESSKRRRLVEIDLLATLTDSDDAVDELMSLWLVERDAESNERIRDMEKKCSPGLVEEESALRAMIDEYGVDWVEPINRLAALLYFRGETEESEKWCRVALAVKPWHFEVMHTMVLNALRRQDVKGALYWRRCSLPRLNEKDNHKRRTKWVEQALTDARNVLDKAEAASESVHFGGDFETSIPGEVWQ